MRPAGNVKHGAGRRAVVHALDPLNQVALTELKQAASRHAQDDALKEGFRNVDEQARAVPLGQALQASGGLWFGWSGKVVEGGTPGEGDVHLQTAGPVQLATVDLSREDHDSYYLGYSNGVLWPVFQPMGQLITLMKDGLELPVLASLGFIDILALMATLIWLAARYARKHGIVSVAGR